MGNLNWFSVCFSITAKYLNLFRYIFTASGLVFYCGEKVLKKKGAVELMPKRFPVQQLCNYRGDERY